MEMDLQYIGQYDMDWIHLAQDKDQRRAPLFTLINPIP
jgi:hypothetical protein